MAIKHHIEKMRGKSEKDKHMIALVGSSVFTALIALVWVSTTFSPMGGSQQQVAVAPETSSTSAIGRAMVVNFDKIKLGIQEVGSSIAQIFPNRANSVASVNVAAQAGLIVATNTSEVSTSTTASSTDDNTNTVAPE
jgi:amino acid permease